MLARAFAACCVISLSHTLADVDVCGNATEVCPMRGLELLQAARVRVPSQLVNDDDGEEDLIALAEAEEGLEKEEDLEEMKHDQLSAPHAARVKRDEDAPDFAEQLLERSALQRENAKNAQKQSQSFDGSFWNKKPAPSPPTPQNLTNSTLKVSNDSNATTATSTTPEVTDNATTDASNATSNGSSIVTPNATSNATNNSPNATAAQVQILERDSQRVKKGKKVHSEKSTKTNSGKHEQKHSNRYREGKRKARKAKTGSKITESHKEPVSLVASDSYHTAANDCVDLLPKMCMFYAAQGYCKFLPGRGAKTCKKSCNRC